MLRLADATPFRRGLSSTSLLVAPLLGLASAIIAPAYSGDVATDLRLISQHHNAFLVNALLEAAAWIVFIPGVLGIVHLLRQRGVVLAHIGGILAVLGMISFVAESVIAQVTAVLARDTAHRALYAQDINSVRHSPLALFVIGIFLGEIGLILLAAAMRRSRRAPSWVVVAVTVAVLVDFAPVPNPFGLVASWLLMGLAFGRIGLIIRNTTDAQWQQPSDPAVVQANVAGKTVQSA
jgi:hypothetical protein